MLSSVIRKADPKSKNYYVVNVHWGKVNGPYPTLKQAIKEAQFWSKIERLEFKIMLEVADDGAL